MQKRHFGSFALATLLSLAPARLFGAPIADLQLSGSSADDLIVTISLDAAEANAEDADWWLLAYTPEQHWLYYRYPDQWFNAGNDLNAIAAAYQGALFDFPAMSLRGPTDLAAGQYSFYFGVDTQMNAMLDLAHVSYAFASTELTAAMRLTSDDFTYLGAFRLPADGQRPATFAYGGDAMTFNPDGDAAAADDGFTGSLFIMGHDRLPYGELPDGNQVAEIDIPAPRIAQTIEELPVAQFLQPFSRVDGGLFDSLEELPTAGMQYLNHAATGAKVHLCWGQHFQDSAETQIPSHAMFDPNLTDPKPQGSWFLGEQSLMSTNAYLTEVPEAWADAHLGGRYLASGRFRDGGWSGQGPSLYAYRPWDANGQVAPPDARLAEIPLLQYIDSEQSDDVVSRSLRGYQHPDQWEGAAWITTRSGKSALLFAGTKATGGKYWYGWAHPQDAETPCVETAFIDQFPVCRLADGTPCAAADLVGCSGHNEYRGWWSSRFDAQFILYDSADLAKVASGEMPAWQPQPYATLDIDEYLFLNSDIEADMLGRGVQRIYRIGEVSFDRQHGLLYVMELFAEEAKPIIHVWRVQ
jgi:hypothetical protein